MGSVAELWRHPIKSHGRETLAAVDLSAGKCLPWDRHWAVTHDVSKYDGSGWARCQNFMIGTLKSTFGHQNFGIYAVVTKDGQVALGDQAQVI